MIPTYPSNRLLEWTRPYNPLRTTNDMTPIDKLTRDSPGEMGVGNYTLNSRLLPPVVLPEYSLNNRADRN